VFDCFGGFETRAVMHWRSCSRSIGVGGICLAALATGRLAEPANAQAMQQVNGSQASGSAASGFNALDPQWAFASPFMSSGFGVGSIAGGINQQAYITKFGSGTAGLFVESNARDSGNFFGAPTGLRQDWFSTLGDPVSRTSIFGSYKSAPATGLFDGLYTTASFGVTSLSMNPSGFSGLPGFSGNDVTAVTARAGVGLQLTPQISIEGSIGFTQGPNSTFR
jgi:hypothetical protein